MEFDTLSVMFAVPWPLYCRPSTLDVQLVQLWLNSLFVTVSEPVPDSFWM